MAESSVPKVQSCPPTLRKVTASQPPSKALKGNISPHGYPMSSVGQGKEKQSPAGNVGSWAPASAKLQAWKGLDVGAAHWPWDRPSQAQLWDTLPILPVLWSFFTTAFCKGLPILLPTAFHSAPIQPNGFKLHFLRVMHIKLLTLSEKILLYGQLYQMHPLDVSKSIYIQSLPI